MLRRSSPCVWLLLACGGAVDPSLEPGRDGSSALSQPTAPSEPNGAAGSGFGGTEPARTEPATPIAAHGPTPQPATPQPQAQPHANADVPEGTLAVDQAWPVAVAVDATYVYWANWGAYIEGGVLRAPKQGGAQEVLVRSWNRPDSLAIDGSYAYFAERVLGTLSRVPLSDGLSVPIVEGVGDLGWALSEQAVYFLDTSSQGIQEVGKQGGDRRSIASTTATSGPLLLHAGYVYWREHFFAAPSSFDGGAQRIWRAAIGGGEPELLVSEPGTVLTGMAVDDQAVYYSVAVALPECGCEGGRLAALAHGETVPRTLATMQAVQMSALTLDTAQIYWTTGSAIYRTSKAGAVTVTVAPDVHSVAALALDEAYVYFATYDEHGSVQRVAK